ncbi:MAG: release factor glutamine methyltransferase [Acidimicrobiia bacterium]|nr:MAG: release factor glutamine methyltransferase [Acidimicrobiia bacterium]
MNAPPTWRELRAQVQAALAAAGCTDAAAEARFLVEEASGYGLDEWPDAAATVAPERARARLLDMCRRRAAGEPLQYVLGAWSFRGLDLMVDRRVLIPRPETEWVAEVALEEAERLGLRRRRGRGPRAAAGPARHRVADLGTGSGALALALERELPDAQVWATDVSEHALHVARANAAGCGATRVCFAAGSWFGALPDALAGTFTLVVSNPPYVAEHEVAALAPEVACHEPRGALVAGPQGTEALAEIVGAAPGWLAPAAALVCELAPHQADAVASLARDAGFDDVAVRDDLAGRPRVLVARRG